MCTQSDVLKQKNINLIKLYNKSNKKSMKQVFIEPEKNTPKKRITASN